MERVKKLIHYLAPDITTPESKEECDYLFKALRTIWEPQELPADFWDLQDAYLKEQAEKKGQTLLSELDEVAPNLYLWQGDITTLKVDAIVNAANNQLLGCFVPYHRCIDNAIHSQAGLQLRLECYQLMQKQGHLEPTGQAKLTKAYNLPAKYVIHTVGPIVQGELGKNDEDLLVASYKSCLKLAVENEIESVAFCCISTGEFHFPNQRAAELAVKTVRDFMIEHPQIKIVFNVFKDEDLKIYREIISKPR